MHAPALASSLSDVVFQDGLGKRRRVVDPASDRVVELLCLRSALTAVPSFEFALQEGVSRVARLNDERFVRILGVTRVGAAGAPLALASECVPGVRLSEILLLAEQRQLSVNLDASIGLIRQLVAAVAILHQHAQDNAHGAIGPERVVITPTGRLVVVEHALAPALEQLRYSRERFWQELRIPIPQSVGLSRFDQRADMLQVGVVALSLLLGRRLREEEYPAEVGKLVASVWPVLAHAGLGALASGPRSWLARALQVDVQNAFLSGFEAWAELEWALAAGERAVPDTAEPLMMQFYACADGDAAVALPPHRAVEHRPRKPVIELVAAPKPARYALEASQPGVAAIRHEAPAMLSIGEGMDGSAPQLWRRQLGAAAIVALVALMGVGVFAIRRDAHPAPGRGAGTLLVNTNPPGAQLIVDGRNRGLTPASLSLAAGEHIVELRGAGQPRILPVSVRAGNELSQYIELPKSPSSRGELEVRTDPPGAKIALDGLALGASPMMLDLSAGDHTVVLRNDLGVVTENVTVKPGARSSLVVRIGAPAASASAASGWLAVTAPLAVQVYENGSLLGDSSSGRLMLAPGRHDLEIVNEVLAYRAAQSVQIAPGKVVPLAITFPKGAIALNAVPWAEVLVDGERVGETPIGNLALPIGPHEIVFRHPDLGQQLHVVSLKLGVPVRLTADLRKK